MTAKDTRPLSPAESDIVDMYAARRIRRLAQWLRALLLLSIALPLGFLAVFAWTTYHLALADAERLVQRTVDVLHENTLKVFETQELILDEVDNLISDRSWTEISHSRKIAAALARLEKGRAQIASIWLLDSTGEVRAASVPWKHGLNGADRDYFRAHLRPEAGSTDTGTYVGKAYVGRITGTASFGFSRRRPTENGTFDGVISISVSSAYFQKFFRDAAPEIQHVAALVRSDGETLIREPDHPNPPKLSPDDPLMRMMAHADHGLIWRVSPVDGVERLQGFRKIEGYPVIVTFAVTKAAVLGPWLQALLLYGGIAAVMGAAFAALTLFALKQLRREEAALLQLDAEAHHRQEIEARLRMSQKLEALGQLTGGVAHDFANLLTPILGNLQLLHDQPDHPRAESLFANALAAAERGQRLIGSLLAFARTQPLALVACDVNVVIGEMEALLRQSLGTDSRLLLTLSPTSRPVRADVSQLEMAVLNLVVNARDAMPRGGTVEISTDNVPLAGEPDGLIGDFIALSVADNGAGMPAEVLAHAFEPFFTTKKKGHGTGLGLASVYGFAKQCGGTAAIKSEVGKGTVVTIYLPQLS